MTKISLSRLTLIYSAGNLFSKALSFLLVFVFTFYLSKEEIGEYDIILTTLALLTPCISLQVDSAIFRWLIDDTSIQNRKTTFRTSSQILIISLSSYTLIYIAYVIFFPSPLSLHLYLLSIVLTALPILQQCARGLRQNMVYITSGIIYSFFYCGFTLIVFHFSQPSIQSILIANILGCFIAIIYLLVQTRYYLNFSFRFVATEEFKKMLSYSLPLLPNSMSWWLILYATRYIIKFYLGDASNGIFAISYKYPSIIIMLTSIFNLAWQEKSIETFSSESRNDYYSSIQENYIKFIFCLAIVFASCSKFLIKNMAEESFFEAWGYIPILLLATVFQSLASFHGSIYLSSKKTSGAFLSSFLGGITTIILGIFSIQIIGLSGISFAILIGFVVMLFIRVHDSKTFYSASFPVYLVLQLSVLLILSSLISAIENDWIYWTNFVLAIAIFIIYNKTIFNRFKHFFNGK